MYPALFCGEGHLSLLVLTFFEGVDFVEIFSPCDVIKEASVAGIDERQVLGDGMG